MLPLQFRRLVAARDHYFLEHNVFVRPIARIARGTLAISNRYFLTFLTTSPKTAVFAIERPVSLWVMKNWLPLVLGPAFAMEMMPVFIVPQLGTKLVLPNL